MGTTNRVKHAVRTTRVRVVPCIVTDSVLPVPSGTIISRDVNSSLKHVHLKVSKNKRPEVLNHPGRGP